MAILTHETTVYRDSELLPILIKVNSSEFILSANEMPLFGVNSLVCIGELLKAHQKPGIYSIYSIYSIDRRLIRRFLSQGYRKSILKVAPILVVKPMRNSLGDSVEMQVSREITSKTGSFTLYGETDDSFLS